MGRLNNERYEIIKRQINYQTKLGLTEIVAFRNDNYFYNVYGDGAIILSDICNFKLLTINSGLYKDSTIYKIGFKSTSFEKVKRLLQETYGDNFEFIENRSLETGIIETWKIVPNKTVKFIIPTPASIEEKTGDQVVKTVSTQGKLDLKKFYDEVMSMDVLNTPPIELMTKINDLQKTYRNVNN